MLNPRQTLVGVIDAFLAKKKKRLDEQTPEWTPAVRPDELQAIWPIIEPDGRRRAHLRFRCGLRVRLYPSVSLILGQNSIWRIDIAPEEVCKLNPPWAKALGLPAQVCGSHYHAWEDNREHMLRSHVWELPARRKVNNQLRRLPQALPLLADAVGIDLTREQHAFDVPPRRDLFDVVGE